MTLLSRSELKNTGRLTSRRLFFSHQAEGGCSVTSVIRRLHSNPRLSLNERNRELVLKNSVRRRVVPSGEFLLVRVFLAVVCLLRGGHGWLRFQVEEPHQSFQVLGHGSQVELLTHELDSA